MLFDLNSTREKGSLLPLTKILRNRNSEKRDWKTQRSLQLFLQIRNPPLPFDCIIGQTSQRSPAEQLFVVEIPMDAHLPSVGEGLHAGAVWRWLGTGSRWCTARYRWVSWPGISTDFSILRVPLQSRRWPSRYKREKSFYFSITSLCSSHRVIARRKIPPWYRIRNRINFTLRRNLPIPRITQILLPKRNWVPPLLVGQPWVGQFYFYS